MAQFDWDQWNRQKSYLKHGITNVEAESIFEDDKALDFNDHAHSLLEDRYICIGKSSFDRILFVSYTMREGKYRIISVRIANHKERTRYGS